jgi:hypothetical protein
MVVVVGPLGFVPQRKEHGHHLFVNSRISILFSFLIQDLSEFFEEERL